jgi:putative thioredoxin
MMSSEHIIEVDETSFQNEVVVYSNTIPVIVDFWAEWCYPCHTLTPILEKLVMEANGAFRLAKVNADENPNLTMQLGIRSLPAVKVFHKSQLVNEFVGLQSEGFVRDFLRNLVPSASSLELSRAQGLLEMKQYDKASIAFRKTLKSDPDNTAALLGLAKSLIAQGEASDALAVLMDFPAGKQYSDAQQLIPLAKSVSKLATAPDHFLQGNLSITFRHALKLITLGNLPAAADGLLEILRQDKNFLKGEVRQAMVGLLILMDEKNPETREYRKELTSILF